MFDLPDTYRVDVKVALKDFIPKDLKPNDKKRIKDAVKSVRLDYQIAGEEIPSVTNEEYRCQVIQFYDIEVANIKDANFLASSFSSAAIIASISSLFLIADMFFIFLSFAKSLNTLTESVSNFSRI